jgi:pimeloyl-ACP methyl ester carboxylesterase
VDSGSRTVDVDGLRIGYRRAGSGAPLLLLHGAFSDSREWRPQLEGLADSFDVIAMDCIGCGASDKAPSGFKLPNYADLVARFLAALDIRSPHLGGLSFGSVYALLFYRYHPTVPRSLVLASAYAGWSGSLSTTEANSRTAWLEWALSHPVEFWGPDFLATVYSDAAPQALRDEAMAILRDVRMDAFGPVARTFAGADLRETLPRVRVPTLLVAGERDLRAPVPVARALQAEIPDARLVVIPGVGHGVNAEAPDAFNGAVREFLAGVG